MTDSKCFRPFNIVTLIASLFGAMCTVWLLPAYGQQEVDPTWHDPWAAASKAPAHPPKAKPSVRRQGTARSGSSRFARKARGPGHDLVARTTDTRAGSRPLTPAAKKEPR